MSHVWTQNYRGSVIKIVEASLLQIDEVSQRKCEANRIISRQTIQREFANNVQCTHMQVRRGFRPSHLVDWAKKSSTFFPLFLFFFRSFFFPSRTQNDFEQEEESFAKRIHGALWFELNQTLVHNFTPNLMANFLPHGCAWFLYSSPGNIDNFFCNSETHQKWAAARWGRGGGERFV